MKILVITENDNCCGPMAVRFLNDFNDSVEAFSAGISPDANVEQNVVKLMHECFCDLSEYKPVQFRPSMLGDADCVVIIGETSFDVSPSKAIRLEVPPLLLESDTLEEMRVLRDYIKNESFVIFKGLVGKN